MNKYKPEGMLISSPENGELISSEKGLERALEKQITLEAPAILCDQDFNLHVSLGPKLKGIIPRSRLSANNSDNNFFDFNSSCHYKILLP